MATMAMREGHKSGSACFRPSPLRAYFYHLLRIFSEHGNPPASELCNDAGKFKWRLDRRELPPKVQRKFQVGLRHF